MGCERPHKLREKVDRKEFIRFLIVERGQMQRVASALKVGTRRFYGDFWKGWVNRVILGQDICWFLSYLVAISGCYIWLL